VSLPQPEQNTTNTAKRAARRMISSRYYLTLVRAGRAGQAGQGA
jgi:hypothetical protein